MTDSLVYSTIRRSNHKRLILCVVGALLLAGLAMLNRRYFYNFFFGPFPIDKQTLLAIDDAGTPQANHATDPGCAGPGLVPLRARRPRPNATPRCARPIQAG